MRIRHVIATAILTVATLNTAHAFNPISIEISESGQPSEWSVDVQGHFSLFLDIVTPDGSVLEPDPFSIFGFDTLPAGRIDFEQTFDSLDSALSFVSGDWSATEVTSRIPDHAETIMREFSVSPIVSNDINRSLPVITSPAPGFEAQNGEPFLLAWDYELPPGEELPNRAVIWRTRTAPPEGGFSRSIRSTPNGVGAGFSTAGAPDFSTRLEAEPGATTNRWLFSASSNEALPQTFDIRVGSYFELDDFVDAPLVDPDNPSRGQIAELTFSRYAETLNLTLGGEPAPPCVAPDAIVGDFDGNGTVEFRDFLVVSQNFGRPVTSYEEGDADCDGFVSFADFLDVSANFGRSATVASPVPEPSTFAPALWSIAVTLLCFRRQRLLDDNASIPV